MYVHVRRTVFNLNLLQTSVFNKQKGLFGNFVLDTIGTRLLKLTRWTRIVTIKRQVTKPSVHGVRLNGQFQLHKLPRLSSIHGYRVLAHLVGSPDGILVGFSCQTDPEKAAEHFVRRWWRESVQDATVFLKIQITIVDRLENSAARNLKSVQDML